VYVFGNVRVRVCVCVQDYEKVVDGLASNLHDQLIVGKFEID